MKKKGIEIGEKRAKIRSCIAATIRKYERGASFLGQSGGGHFGGHILDFLVGDQKKTFNKFQVS